MFYPFSSNKLENEQFFLIGCGGNWLPTNYKNPPPNTSAKKWRFFPTRKKNIILYNVGGMVNPTNPPVGMFYLHLGVSKNNGIP